MSKKKGYHVSVRPDIYIAVHILAKRWNASLGGVLEQIIPAEAPAAEAPAAVDVDRTIAIR